MNITQKNIKELLHAITEVFEEHKEELCGYDRAIGDGDHGESMARGTKAGYEAICALPEELSVFEYFKAYGRAMLATIGGAIGPIFSTVIMELGRCAKVSGEIGAHEYVTGLRRAADKVMDLGGAVPGDKTLVDALVPAAETAEKEREKSFEEIADAVQRAAGAGAESTVNMQAKMGRSHFLREKSVGHQDAGATSLYLMLKCIGEFVNES